MSTRIDIKKTAYTDPKFRLYNNLHSDAARFATFREAQKQRELNAATNDAARRRVEKRYAEYLKTEKHGIFANCAAAERWTGFQDNADLYPNLEWRTAGDNDVRPEHAALHGLVLPINDPFWKTHTPPLGFGCRCELIQTDATVQRKQGYKKTTVPRGFDFNPGIEQKVFSDSAGYYTSAPVADVDELGKQAKAAAWRVTQKEVRNELKASKLKLEPPGKLKGKTIILSNSDIKNITGKNHDDPALRDLLLYDIQNVVKESTFVADGEEKGNEISPNKRQRHANYDRWFYYKIKGYDMYLNFKKYKGKELYKLHAITDKIQKK